MGRAGRGGAGSSREVLSALDGFLSLGRQSVQLALVMEFPPSEKHLGITGPFRQGAVLWKILAEVFQ